MIIFVVAVLLNLILMMIKSGGRSGFQECKITVMVAFKVMVTRYNDSCSGIQKNNAIVLMVIVPMKLILMMTRS